jgi:hypothetical protein
MKKYKLLGWNKSNLDSYIKRLCSIIPSKKEEFELIKLKFSFPMIVEMTGEVGIDGLPTIFTGLEFPYDEFSITWFDYEEIFGDKLDELESFITDCIRNVNTALFACKMTNSNNVDGHKGRLEAYEEIRKKIQNLKG